MAPCSSEAIFIIGLRSTTYSPRDDLGVVVLEAVDALGVLRAAVDALQVVLAAPPIVLYSFNVPAKAKEFNNPSWECTLITGFPSSSKTWSRLTSATA